MIKLDSYFHYPNQTMHFQLHIQAQEKVAMIGASGAGKSTLLNLIAGFELVDKGEIWLNGQNHTFTAPYQRPVSMLFQDNNLFTHLTVEQNIALGLKPSLSLNSQEKSQVAAAANAVGLADFLTRSPNALSGGQKQRVALARCLLRDKPILLLDEPFSALDPALRQEMLSLLDALCQQKKLTLLIVTHQPDELKGKIDRIISVQNGRICNKSLP
ncbi:thiamine ABC transporter ATP-binding protein [Avibacterium paragallinarum]|uniref:Thiamine ABC transporter ATP-binding protein n=1 Tax=Avibacterium paragallinarum TaxID=728 RepID=A0A0F5F0F1_AVIPA|nr:thiamine ABC transporter ATP-binding protein [Avibacterium paragallinarum]KAA6208224.1 thiamine ABC transporter ATP-binding protein [Avibacterium paragallinarum]KKB01667.1 thiamine ABC transporter ATP-binding protein [Avibacterium paragallinarum]RZN55441.1 thiamine ABC transporter ATP-binding protein [Avibacterium paragallinarum]RZN56573.1 thiamine ABC transporter ATP-binding protein [Avibacterium paragallinarum]RZN72707.1 thiamine ABC transporter ATP-binding protein [Avibacterium paragalli